MPARLSCGNLCVLQVCWKSRTGLWAAQDKHPVLDDLPGQFAERLSIAHSDSSLTTGELVAKTYGADEADLLGSCTQWTGPARFRLSNAVLDGTLDEERLHYER